MAADGGEKGKQLFGLRARSRQPDRPPVGPRPVRRRGTVITSLAERRLRGSERNRRRRVWEREGRQRHWSGSSHSSVALLSHYTITILYTPHARTNYKHTHTHTRARTYVPTSTYTHIHTRTHGHTDTSHAHDEKTSRQIIINTQSTWPLCASLDGRLDNDHRRRRHTFARRVVVAVFRVLLTGTAACLWSVCRRHSATAAVAAAIAAAAVTTTITITITTITTTRAVPHYALGVLDDRRAMELRVGNKYRLGRKIGSGSFGDIYLGEYFRCGLHRRRHRRQAV